VAMQLRPDLNQARLQVQRGDLELVKTRNGLLPRLDVFATLGKTGYANSFGPSVGNIFNEQGYNAAVGFSGDYPPLNRGAIATNQRALFNRDQSVAAVSNLEQLAQVDVRSAYIAVIRSREEITATSATVRAQQETLRAETEKFREGKSTTFQVAQAQRDLVQSQIANLQAIVDHLNALVDLYRLDGSLLIRRGIAAPGNKPVAMTKKTEGR
jgi:outer membrane protein